MKQNYVFNTINNQNFNATNTTNKRIKTQSLRIFFYKESNLFFKHTVYVVLKIKFFTCKHLEFSNIVKNENSLMKIT